MEKIKDLLDRFDRATKTTKHWKELVDKHPSLVREMKSAYFRIFKVKARENCDMCVFDIWAKIKELKDHDLQRLLSLKYKLKDGKVLPYGNTHVTQESAILSNEICEQLLKKYGPDIFDIMPDPNDKERVIVVKDKEVVKNVTVITNIKPVGEKNEVITNIFEGLTKKELQGMCVSYPEKEWKKLNKTDLEVYLKSKIK